MDSSYTFLHFFIPFVKSGGHSMLIYVKEFCLF